jgi:hypothetical protein
VPKVPNTPKSGATAPKLGPSPRDM